MFDKMKQLMEMKKQADRMKKELDATHIDSDTNQGVKIVINGSQNFQSIEVDESLISPENKGKLEVTLLRSINVAIKDSQNVAAQKMKDLMPGGFPGM